MNDARILLVGQESVALRRLRGRFRREGWKVLSVPGDMPLGATALRVQPDLVLISTPRLDVADEEQCHLLRQISIVPIILITDQASADHVVAGLENGADDCVSTAMPMQELVARVRARLRYASGWPLSEHREVIAFPALRIDLGRHSVFVRDRELSLRAKEFDLLTLLARHPGEVVTHGEIIRLVWGRSDTGDAKSRRTVSVHMRWLRQKIEEDPDRPSLLRTERHVGYRLVPGNAPRSERQDICLR
jgi:DNA-binding response OmpR family regulator